MKIKALILIVFFALSAFSDSALPLPEKGDLELGELLLCLSDYKGKIVEVDISAIHQKTIRGGITIAECHFFGGDTVIKAKISFPTEEDKDAADCVEELFNKPRGCGGRTRLYVHVDKEGNLAAVGTRFNKSKGIYTW